MGLVNRSVSHTVTRLTPERPAARPSHSAGTPMPSADTPPKPVITTRRMSVGRGLRVGGESRLQRGGHLAHALHLLGNFVRNRQLEALLEGEQQVHPIQRVDPQLEER